MQFEVTQLFNFKDSISVLDPLLRKYYFEHPELQLDKPFESIFPEDLTHAIHDLVGDYPPILFGGSYISDEVLNFYKSNIVAQFHPNYLPASVHNHSFFEIIYVLEGICHNYSGNQNLELLPGDVVILAPNTKHALSVFSDNCQVVNLLIRTSIFEETFFNSFSAQDLLYQFFTNILYGNKTNTFLLFHTKSDPVIQMAVLNLLDEQNHFRYYQESMKISYMSLIFNRLLNQHEENSVVFSDTHIEANHDVALILRYMQQHFQKITLTDLAEFFGYSERHMTRILKNYTGEGFQKNIQYIRMQYALKYLANKDYSLEDIATKVGYSSVRNFRDIFKQQFGVSPREYRKPRNEL